MNLESTIKRRWVRISREGFSFLFAISFILIAATVKQINLLFFMSGLLIAVMFFNWRYAIASIRKIRVKRNAPNHIHAGQPLVVDLVVCSGLQWLTARSLIIRNSIERTNAPLEQKSPRKNKTMVSVAVSELAPNQSSTASYRCVLPKRGTYTLGPMMIATRFPLGLVWAFGYTTQQKQILVAPQIGRMVGRWSKLASHDQDGEQELQQQSRSIDGDFHSLRPWQSGDSRHSIHWRSSAKSGELRARQTAQRAHDSYAILLDLWQPEEASVIQKANVELATSVAATAVQQLQTSESFDFICSGKTSKRFHGKSRNEQLDSIFSHLATAQGGDQTAVAACVATLLSAKPTTTCETGTVNEEVIESSDDPIQVTGQKKRMRLVVISTRPNWLDTTSGLESIDQSKTYWIDVSSNDLESWYQMS